MRTRVATVFLFLFLAGCSEPRSDLTAGVQESDLPPSFTNSVGMKLVKVLSGKFIMGEEGLENYRDDHRSAAVPLHEVELSCFYLAEKEVTKAQFREYVKTKGFSWKQYPQVDPTAVLPHVGKGHVLDAGALDHAQKYLLQFPYDDFPITDVSWEDSANFCKWLSEKEGLTYRLPTEAEWEYACRAGTRTTYWWGDKFDPKMARVGGDYVEFRGWFSPFAPVGSYSPNPWGLYDMHGNVDEWVADFFDWDYYKHSPRKDPKGPAFGKYRVIRGGGGNSEVGDPQAHAGARDASAKSYIATGFRIACEAASVAKSQFGKPESPVPSSKP